MVFPLEEDVGGHSRPVDDGRDAGFRRPPPASPRIRRTPESRACDGSEGVEGTLEENSAPSDWRTAMTSVNVPPVSTPIRN